MGIIDSIEKYLANLMGNHPMNMTNVYPSPSPMPTLEPIYNKMIDNPAIPPQAKDNAKQILLALKQEDALTPRTGAYALATAQHETNGTFQPVREGYYLDQKYNYPPGFSGEQIAMRNGYSGGPKYYGRGFVQLTHDYNYKDMANRLGMPELASDPDKALDPQVAAKVLAAFMKDRGVTKTADSGNFIAARRPINGLDKASTVAGYANNYLKDLN